MTTLAGDVVREIGEWWQRRHNPRPVASFDRPTYLDEVQWAATLPTRLLRRQAKSLDRMTRRQGRLVGENIARARAIRTELRRRLEASQSPNRGPMDWLSEGERGFIRGWLGRRTAR